MSGSTVLYAGIGAIVLAIIAVAAVLMPARAAKPSVSRALAAIDEQYSREAPSSQGDGPVLPHWLENVAIKLSPAGIATIMQRRLDVAGNPQGWTTDRMLAVKELGSSAPPKFSRITAVVEKPSRPLMAAWLGMAALAGWMLMAPSVEPAK